MDDKLFEQLIDMVTCKRDDAKAFLIDVIDAFHVWDDLVDCDKDVSAEAADKAFFAAFVGIPSNPFYVSNFGYLFPILANAVTNWRAANVMERSPESKLDTEIAFITRSEYINLIIETARLCGGHELAERAAVHIRRMTHFEGYDGYLANLAAEKERRDARH